MSDGTTNDDVLITAGSNITINPVAAGGFTIAAVVGAGLGVAASADDVLSVTGGEIAAVNVGDDRIIFFDNSTDKLRYLDIGTGLTITGTTITANSDAGKTYDLSVQQTGGNNNNPAIRLSDGTSNDNITITGGSNVTVTRNSGTQFTIAASSDGGGGLIGDVTVDYTGRSSPCALPITVSEPSAGTKQINIPDNSNAFGAKYVQTTEPTGSSVCNGDIWYDTSTGSGGSGGVLTGTIHMWGGSTGSIPSGYQLCDGSAASTSELQAITGANVPDLRDRFIVGAGSGYTVNATGGSADAVVVQHNHDYSNFSDPGNHKHNVLNNCGFETDSQGGGSDYFIDWGSGGQELNTAQDGGSHTHSLDIDNEGESGTNKNLPPYYALVYMIKT